MNSMANFHWHAPRHVAFHEVGPDGRVRYDALADWLQGAAADHAHALGISTDDLYAKGQGWSATRMTVHVNDLPGMDRTINLETWPAAYDKRFFYRDYLIKDERNQTLVAATTRWSLFDVQARKALPVPDDMAAKVTVDPERADDFSEKPAGAIADGAADFERLVVSRWTDLDINGHVNNARLLGWVMEGLDRSMLAEKTLAALDISFRTECTLDTPVLSRSVAEETGGYRHALVNLETGKDIVRATTIWR